MRVNVARVGLTPPRMYRLEIVRIGTIHMDNDRGGPHELNSPAVHVFHANYVQ